VITDQIVVVYKVHDLLLHGDVAEIISKYELQPLIGFSLFISTTGKEFFRMIRALAGITAYYVCSVCYME